MAPVVFSPMDPHTLFIATQFVMKTTDEGKSWKEISPDLTIRPKKPGEEGPPKSSGLVAPTASSTGAQVQLVAARISPGHSPHLELESLSAAEAYDPGEEYERGEQDDEANRRGTAISVVSPSSLSAGVIWAGTNNGLIQRTQDGGANWLNVSPEQMTDKANIWTIEPSHFDAATAYIAYEVRRDLTPYAFRTHDGGKTWKKITDGLRPEWRVRAVREDPVRKGLLYCAT